MDTEQVVFLLVKFVCSSFAAFVCVCRAVRMDNRVRPFVVMYYVIFGMSSAGLAASAVAFVHDIMPMHMVHICIIGFMAAVCCMFIDGQARWESEGIPNELLKPKYRWPQYERRRFKRRAGDRGTQEPPQD